MSELDLLRKIADLEARLARLESDDRTRYSTGTWTPSFTGTGTAGVFTYTVQVGFYTRIGRLVFYNGDLGISAISTPPVGNMRISGLPFAAENTSSNYSPAALGYIHNFNFSAGALGMAGYTVPNSTQVYLAEYYDNASAGAAPAANFTNANCYLIFGGVYQAG